MGGSISTAAAELKTTRRQIRNSLAVAKSFVESAGLGHQ
jgi:transcriptional antiterminator